MATPRKRKRTKKRKVRVRTRAVVARKDSTSGDTLPKAPTQMPRDNGINMRIKIKRKR